MAKVIFISAYGTYWYCADILINHAQGDLQSLALMKAAQIEALLADWSADAGDFASRRHVWQVLAGIDLAYYKPSLEIVIAKTQHRYGYSHILVINPSLQIINQTNAYQLNPNVRIALSAAMRTRSRQIVEPYLDTSGTLTFAIVHPVFTHGENDGAVIGAVCLERNLHQDLSPILQPQLSPNTSAETLLARRDGNEIVYLNRLRFHSEIPPLQFHLPSTQTTLMQALLVQGQTGMLEGVDYRGVKIIGFAQHIAGSSWGIVTKIDRAEIEYPAKILGWITLGQILILMTLLGLGFWVLWYRQTQAALQLTTVQLQERERELKNAQRLAKIGDWQWDIRTNKHTWSEQVYAIYGFDPNQPPVIYPEIQKNFTPESWTKLKAAVDRCLSDGTPYVLDAEITPPDGQRRWITAMGEIVRDAAGHVVQLRGTMQDITERKLAELALLEAEWLLNDIQSKTGFGTWTYDVERKESQWSREMFNIWGVDPEHGPIAYFEHQQWIHPEDFHSFEDAMREAVELAKPYVLDLRIIRPDKTEKSIITSCKPLSNLVGKVVKLIGSNYDITQRKQAVKELEASEERAQQANKAKSRFLASMSHEIRTPMNAIINLSHLALQTALTAKQRDYLTKVSQAGKNLLGIIDDILDFSKIEADKLILEQVPFRLADVIVDCLNLVTPRAKENGIEIIVDACPTILDRLIGDPLRLRQILINLLTNAVKFSRNNTEIMLGIDAIDISAKRIQLEFSICDVGIGMTREQQKSLFQPFHQADSTITRRYGGTGLGLAITQRLLKLMGSTLFVESALTTGSMFSFMLDVPIAPTLPELVEPPLPSTISDHDLAHIAGAAVLLVEDNEINQQIAQELLTGVGLNVTIANNGLIALNILENKSFDLILMDVQMPEMDGYEATRQIRLNDRIRTLPIVAMTAHAMSGDREKCLEVGMDAYIAKPIVLPEFYAALVRWIKPSTRGLSLSKPQLPATDLVAFDKLRQPVPIEETVILPTKLSGIDLAQGLSLVNGNKALYRQLLLSFRTHNLTLSNELVAAFTAAKWQEARLKVHNLKGVAGNLAATNLFQAATILDKLLTDGQYVEAMQKLDCLTRALNEILDTITQLETTHPLEIAPIMKTTTTIIDSAQLRSALQELPELMDNDVIAARTSITTIGSLLVGTQLHADFQALNTAVFEHDFDAAQIIVQRIITTLNNLEIATQ